MKKFFYYLSLTLMLFTAIISLICVLRDDFKSSALFGFIFMIATSISMFAHEK